MSANSKRASTPVGIVEASTSQVPPAAEPGRVEKQVSRAVHARSCVPGTCDLGRQNGTSERQAGDELTPRATNIDAQLSSTSAWSTKPSDPCHALQDDHSEHPWEYRPGNSADYVTVPQHDLANTVHDEDLSSPKLWQRRALPSSVSTSPEFSPFRRAEATSLHKDGPFSRFDLGGMPNEIITHILSYLEVYDLLATSRTSHHLRTLSLQPFLHALRLQNARSSLRPLLCSPFRPTLGELIARHILLTNTTQASRRLGRNLVAIRLSRRIPQRPSAEALVQRGVLPPECVEGTVAPGLVARKRAVERERLKDGLRHWVGGVWRGEVRERGEDVKQCEEKMGIGRVWRLRKFWERVANGEAVP